MNSAFIPWVEKYRPHEYENVILSKTNDKIFRRIIEEKHFPNLIFYGPPGSGKTTTIISLVRLYLTKHYQYSNEFIIHLNASDERGIDMIRTQITTFVDSKQLFYKGFHFIILDEVDYMTKTAQHALSTIIGKDNIRFILICNYISKIELCLRNNFIIIQFNSLPKDKIISKLEYICTKEGIKYNNEWLHAIQHKFKNDIRSMINFIQKSRNMNSIMVNDDIKGLIMYIKEYSVEECYEKCYSYYTDMNNEPHDFIQHSCEYLIRYQKDHKSLKDIIKLSTTLIHSTHSTKYYALKLFLYSLKDFISCIEID